MCRCWRFSGTNSRGLRETETVASGGLSKSRHGREPLSRIPYYVQPLLLLLLAVSTPNNSYLSADTIDNQHYITFMKLWHYTLFQCFTASVLRIYYLGYGPFRVHTTTKLGSMIIALVCWYLRLEDIYVCGTRFLYSFFYIKGEYISSSLF